MATSSTEPDYGQQQQHSSFLAQSGLKDGDTSQGKSLISDKNAKSVSSCQPFKSNNKLPSIANKWNNLPLVALCNIFAHLEPSDRLKASSTCHSWRNVVYTSSLWPRRNLRVNLCSHKFTIPSNDVNQANLKSGFHTFNLQSEPHGSNNQKRLHRGHRHGNTHKTFNEPLKTFVSKCTPFLTGLTIYFDPNSSYNVIDTIKILKHLSENEVPIYELNPSSSNITAYANCRNLKSLILVPVIPLVRSAFSERFTFLYYGLTDAIRFLLSKCQRLDELCLGDLHDLICSTDVFLRELAKSGREHAIRRLHLSSIKGNAFRYIQQSACFANFEKFTSLSYLAIDLDALDSVAVETLSKLTSLCSLTINIHHFNRHNPEILEDCWTGLSRALPELTATINLLHTQAENFKAVFELLTSELPIRCFRAYYLELKDGHAEPLMCNLLDTLSMRHGKTLETAAFVEHLRWPKRYLKSNAPNAFVMFTWRCRALLDLTIIGFELTEIDVIAIARLRGPALRNFHFPAHCIELTKSFSAMALTNACELSEDFFYFADYLMYYDDAPPMVKKAFDESVSVPLERNWCPTEEHEIPEYCQAFNYEPQMTYQRTLLEHN